MYLSTDSIYATQGDVPRVSTVTSFATGPLSNTLADAVATVVESLALHGEVKRRRALTHAAAWAIKQAVWTRNDAGEYAGKSGRVYAPAVVAMLEAAYPLPANATAAQRAAVRVARSKLFGLVDRTTEDGLGVRGDRKSAGPKSDDTRAVSEAWSKASDEQTRIGDLCDRALTMLAKGDRRQAQELLSAARTLARDGAALARLGQVLGLEG